MKKMNLLLPALLLAACILAGCGNHQNGATGDFPTAPTAEPTSVPTITPMPIATPTSAPTITPIPAGTPTAAPADTGTGTVTGDVVRVRSGPGTDSAIVTELREGTSVKVLGVYGQWYKISKDDITGYMHRDYISVVWDRQP